jgi:hypothetical protein
VALARLPEGRLTCPDRNPLRTICPHHVVFALPDTVAGSQRLVDTVPYIRRHIRTYQGGILEVEAAALFERFDPGTLVYVRTGIPGG